MGVNPSQAKTGQWLACIARAKVFPYSKIITSGRKTGKKAVCIEDDSVTLHTYKVCEGALSERPHSFLHSILLHPRAYPSHL